MAWGCRGTNSIARRRTPCQAASVRGQSNQVLSEVLRAGRESTAGLSPLSTPDSILICYRKLEKGHFANVSQGVAGLTGRVNNHYWRLFGAVFIGGALRGGMQALQIGLSTNATGCRREKPGQ